MNKPKKPKKIMTFGVKSTMLIKFVIFCIKKKNLLKKKNGGNRLGANPDSLRVSRTPYHDATTTCLLQRRLSSANIGRQQKNTG